MGRAFLCPLVALRSVRGRQQIGRNASFPNCPSYGSKYLLHFYCMILDSPWQSLKKHSKGIGEKTAIFSHLFYLSLSRNDVYFISLFTLRTGRSRVRISLGAPSKKATVRWLSYLAFSLERFELGSGVNSAPVGPKSRTLSEAAAEGENLPGRAKKKAPILGLFRYL